MGPKTQELLQTHAARLVSVATYIDEWNSSIWGKNIKFVTHDSLRQATDVWRDFLGPEFSTDSQLCRNSSDQARDNAQQTLKTRSTYVNNNSVLTGIRSAFPLALQALKELPALHREYWQRGFLGTVTASDRPNVANRTIFAIGDRHGVLHYGTDPLLGFHLATAYAPLSKGASLSPLAPGAVAAAQKEFATWCDVLRHASDRVVMRCFIGDALSLCHTLQGSRNSDDGISANLKTHRWTFEDLLLDSGDYVSDGNAPTSFDVVDCSNLVDHLGALNVLTATAPLLKRNVSSTLYTEILVAHEASARDRMNNLLCGDYETISLLLGLIAVTSWSNATATSEVEEGLIASLAKTNKSSDRAAYQSRSRLAWKLLHALSPVKPWISPEDVAKLLHSVYANMFSHEDTSQLMGRIQLEGMEKVSNPHYTRVAFATIVKAVQTNVDSD